MKTREERIAFDMNYCQHYDPQGLKKGCKAGMDISKIQNVPVGNRGFKWGPCIEGHTLSNALDHCPKWLRQTREHAEKRADAMEADPKRFEIVMPVVAQWRKKPPLGKEEVIECPACRGRLHLSQSSYNGHVHGKCETQGCVSWME